MTVFTTSGRRLQLGLRLGGGGEGTVYEVSGLRDAVAKIYHPGNGMGERLRKLQAMVGQPPAVARPQGGHVPVAWPLEILYGDAGQRGLVGYTMPRLKGSLPAASLYLPSERAHQAPGFTWEYLMTTAAHLAATVQSLHDAGCVVGDLNESNVVVTSSALVTLIDTDSFQITVHGQCFRSPVGKPEYTPPERHGADLLAVDRASSDDHFALAVLVFQLLMEGRHPFDGVPRTAADVPDTAGRIRANWFLEAHACPRGRVIPGANCPEFGMLPPAVRQLFVRCFVDGATVAQARPSASQWASCLQSAKRDLKTCSANPHHRYGAHLTSCPWCARIRDSRLADPFPNPKARPAAARALAAATVRAAPAPTMPRQASSASTLGSTSAAQTSARYCTKCGRQLEPQWRFCPRCRTTA